MVVGIKHYAVSFPSTFLFPETLFPHILQKFYTMKEDTSPVFFAPECTFIFHILINLCKDVISELWLKP